MITPTRAIIGVLAVAVVGLGIALGVVLAGDDDGSDDHMMAQAQGFAGMMSAMAAVDSNAMLEHMKEVLGEDGFERMQQHFEDHRLGTSVAGMTDVDQMMHTLMDGVMSEMHILPRSGPEGETATATTSPTATR